MFIASRRYYLDPLFLTPFANDHVIRLAVVTTHPVQYIAPWFRSLAARPDLDIHVIYFRELNPVAQGVGFGQSFQWDVPLREGYSSESLRCGASKLAVPGLALRLLLALRRIRADAVLVTGWNEPGLLAAYPLAKLCGARVLLRGESNNLRARGRLAAWLHRQIVRSADAILTIGKANRAFYVGAGASETALFPGAYFVESDRLLAMAAAHIAERDAIRTSLGFQSSDFVFAFCGKHVPFKRPMMLIEAAAQVRAKGFAVKLLMAGSGELTEALRHRAVQLAVPTVFTGFLNQSGLWQGYLPADAFVLPSTNRETWGLVTNEAMLFGLPVIVSDQVGGGPDLVVEGQTGYVFSGEAEGLADAMQRLLVQGRPRMRAMGEVARQHVLEHYSMANATAGLDAALDAVLARSVPR
jgi:glycosyltransferase involved in cell wall biosynthesis